MKNTRRSSGIVASGAFAALILFPVWAAQSGKKSFAFHGKVERIDTAGKRLVVTNEPIEGWMGTMTMGYTVDSEDVLNRVKPGDQITAKVYEGDFKLYEVEVVALGKPLRQPGAAIGTGVSLEDLEQLALANNPTIKQGQANMQVAAGVVLQVGLYPNPTVGYYGDEIRGGSFGGGEQGLFVGQTIVLGGKLGAARRVARLKASQVETGAQVQKVRILNDVRTLFYQVLAAQKMVDVRQSLVEIAGDAVQTSRQLGNVGQADRPDILQAEVEQQQAALSLRLAQQNRQAAWRILAAVVGKPGLAAAKVDGDLEAIPDLNYEECVATALRESPEVSLALQGVSRREASLTQTRKVPIPDLQVTGILMHSYEALPTTGRPTGLIGGVQVGVQLPIFNRNQGNIAAAKGEIDSAKQELVRVKLELERRLSTLFRDYDSARVTVFQYKAEVLPRAQQAYKLYKTNYQSMAAAYPQVLISQRTLFQLEADYIQALETVWQSAIRIQGFGLADGLAEPGDLSTSSAGRQ
jgi:cobalt-zinc-cadmium efflux system outer membrane protein